MQKASTGLLIAGWIFSVLGGLIGSLISTQIIFSKTATDGGQKVATYDEASRTQGKAMLIVGVCVIVAANLLMM